LTVFNPEDLTLYGLEADLASHGTEFLRSFDVKSPDPALTSRRLRRFVQEVKLLYLRARILHKSNEGTITAIILKTLANSRATFFWKNEVKTLGWVGDHGAVRRALKRVQTIARLLIDTLEMEFHDDLFPQWWEFFDLYDWQSVEPANGMTRLWSKFNKLCRSRSFNEITAAREISIVQKIALEKYNAFPERARESDGVLPEPGGVSAPDSARGSGRGLNRKCWADAMEEAEATNGMLPIAKAIYAWYKSESHSTCDVERLIGTVKKQAGVKHSDVGSSILRDDTTVAAFGPKTAGDLATRKVVGHEVILVPTDYLHRCNEIWLANFGRRYCVNQKPRKDKGTPRVKKVGTDKAIAAAVAHTRRSLVSNAQVSPDSLIADLSISALEGPGAAANRTPRQMKIATHARNKLSKLRTDAWANGSAGVSAAAPQAKAKAKAKAKAAAKAAARATAEKIFYPVLGGRRPPLLAGRQWGDAAASADVIVVEDLLVVQRAREGGHMPDAVLWAMLYGKRIATPPYCSLAAPGGGTSILFQPCLRKPYKVFSSLFLRPRAEEPCSSFRRQ